MAPDGEKVRQRRVTSSKIQSSSTTTFHSNANDDDDDLSRDRPTTTTPTTTTSHKKCIPLSQLQSTEMCIDGIIYDITQFQYQHPGGSTFLMFGGNDVTIQYKMIHPYHTNKHLLAMGSPVGTVQNYHSEYKFDTEFERDIKKEVFQIVHRGKEFATIGYLFRAICYIALYMYLQSIWIHYGPTYTLAFIYGVAQAMIGMNVQHDANHGAISKKYVWLNDLFGFGADFIGGSKWLWIEQHWTHHAYTNHAQKDPDSFGAEPLVNFNDYPIGHTERKWFHHYQGFYYIFVLGGYWLSAVFNPQVLDLRQRGAQRIGIQMEHEFVHSRRKYAIALRLLYIYIHVIHPIRYFGFTPYVIGAILFMGFCESITLATLFSLSHNFEQVDRDPTYETKRDPDGKVCWFKSQVETSSTYGGAISGYATGGLNFQIEHHLFPRMSSAWYPYIAPVVRKVCKKHNVRYVHYPWVFQNLWSTMAYMHQAGTGMNWKDGNPYTGKL